MGVKSGTSTKSFTVEKGGQRFVVVPCSTIGNEAVDCPAGVAAWILPDESTRIVNLNLKHSCGRKMELDSLAPAAQPVDSGATQPGTLVVSLNGGIPTPIDLGKAGQISNMSGSQAGRPSTNNAKMRFTMKSDSLQASQPKVSSSAVQKTGFSAPGPSRRAPARPPRPRPVLNSTESSGKPIVQTLSKPKHFIKATSGPSASTSKNTQPGSAFHLGALYADFDALNDAIHAWYSQRFPQYLLTVRRREEGGRPTWTCRGEKTPILCHFRISAKREGNQLVITHVRLHHFATTDDRAH